MNELPFDSLHEEAASSASSAWTMRRESSTTAFMPLQHRGQEACGIVSAEEGRLASVKGEGLVTEVFNGDNLSTLHGRMAIGHVRYSTAGGGGRENVQPFVFRHHTGDFALAHNGNLVNSRELVRYLEDKGSLFHSTSDSEIPRAPHQEGAQLGAPHFRHHRRAQHARRRVRLPDHDREPALTPAVTSTACVRCRSAGSTTAGSSARRPARWTSWGAEFVRDVNPGEIVTLDRNGIRSRDYSMYKRNCMCAMEYIYFARPDSDIECCNVHAFRKESGRLLFEEAPADADVVIGCPIRAFRPRSVTRRPAASPMKWGWSRTVTSAVPSSSRRRRCARRA